MDFSQLSNQSEKIMAVIEEIKNNPNLLEELKINPEETLKKIGIELNENELEIVQKLESINEIQAEALSIFEKIKGFLGFK